MAAPTSPPDVPDDQEISREEAEELVKELERRRSLRGIAAVVVATVGILFSIFQLFLAAQSFTFEVGLPFVGSMQVSLQSLQANAVHVGFALVLAFLLFPPSTGDGFVIRGLGRVRSAIATRFGDASPITRAADGVRGVLRWLFLDPDRERVTPFDVACIAGAILSPVYFLTSFREINAAVSFGGPTNARPLAEIVRTWTVTVEEVPVLGGYLVDVVHGLADIVAAMPVLGDVSVAFLLGVVGVLLVLEATRRTLGLPLTLLVAVFIVYARWGYLIGGDLPLVDVLRINELTWNRIVQNLWYNTENGVFGIPVSVSVQFIYIFILFGAFLEMSGAGQWFIDLAYSATGKRKGGTAKSSILASGFMGMISGSSIANTVTTGAFTIPLMKRSGYSPEFSGAVESSASSGGQILPPVMGAAIFIMIQYTATPLADLIIVAAVPAIVFFFGVWVMVHLKATEAGIAGITDAEVVDVREHLTKGWFYLIPIVLLLYFLIVVRVTESRSAWYTLVAIGALVTLIAAYSSETRGRLAVAVTAIVGGEFVAHFVGGVGVLGLLTGDAAAGLPPRAALDAVLGGLGWYLMAAGALVLLSRPSMDAPLLDLDPAVEDAAEAVGDSVGRNDLANNQFVRVVTFFGKSMDDGARTAVPVVIAVAAAGIIPGVISVSGLGPNLTSLLIDLSGGSIVVLLVITAIAGIILGMGMPTTVTYIILASMLVNPLIEFGVPMLAAHLYILYFGVIADITPPVAVAAYAASGVAKSNPHETGIKAFSLSLNKAIVPFAFVFVPGIILLREKANAADLDPREQFRVVGFGDLTELTYSVPEILVPIVGVFVGVVALGATVIGVLYTGISRLERIGFALSAILLMAPALLTTSVFDLLGLVGPSISLDGVGFDVALRAAGFAIFALLAVRNRRKAETESPAAETEASPGTA